MVLGSKAVSEAKQSESSPELSLVIPYFNDYDRVVRRLPEVKAFFDARGSSYEVLLVDDGSSVDETADLGRRFPWLKVLRDEKNRGKGHAVRRGMLAARGRNRFFTDSDIPFGLSPIDDAVGHLDRGCDVVIGDRGLPASVYHVEQKLPRRLASHVFTLLVSRVIVPGVRDTQCGFKGFRGEAAEMLFRRTRLDGFAFDVEIVYVAVENGLTLQRVPVVLEHAEDSRLRLVRDSLVMMYELALMKWNDARGLYG